ncbi:MAG: hypothetical protein WC222_01180 [Parachlamydiales bacterium]|jgi:hypothetical protein
MATPASMCGSSASSSYIYPVTTPSLISLEFVNTPNEEKAILKLLANQKVNSEIELDLLNTFMSKVVKKLHPQNALEEDLLVHLYRLVMQGVQCQITFERECPFNSLLCHFYSAFMYTSRFCIETNGQCNILPLKLHQEALLIAQHQIQTHIIKDKTTEAIISFETLKNLFLAMVHCLDHKDFPWDNHAQIFIFLNENIVRPLDRIPILERMLQLEHINSFFKECCLTTLLNSLEEEEEELYIRTAVVKVLPITREYPFADHQNLQCVNSFFTILDEENDYDLHIPIAERLNKWFEATPDITLSLSQITCIDYICQRISRGTLSEKVQEKFLELIEYLYSNPNGLNALLKLDPKLDTFEKFKKHYSIHS